MIEIKTMTMEEAEKIGYVTVLKGYKMEELYSELKSVWSTYSEKTRDNWVMLLGGLKGKSEIMALMNEVQEG